MPSLSKREREKKNAKEKKRMTEDGDAVTIGNYRTTAVPYYREVEKKSEGQTKREIASERKRDRETR